MDFFSSIRPLTYKKFLLLTKSTCNISFFNLLRNIIIEIDQGVHEQACGHAPKLGDQILEVMFPLIP